MCLLNSSPLSQLRQTVSKWQKGKEENQPVTTNGQWQFWFSSVLFAPSSITSIIRLSTGIVVLTMCTFGVDVERCLWDREPSEEGLDGLKVKAWGVEYLCWELRRKERKRESCGYFFPLQQVKNTVQCNLSKSNIHTIPSREKAGTYTSTKLFGQLNHAQFNLRNKF